MECPETVVSYFLYHCDKHIENFLRKLRRERNLRLQRLRIPTARAAKATAVSFQCFVVSYVFHVINALPLQLLTISLCSHFQESGNSTTYHNKYLEEVIIEIFEFLSRCYYIHKEQIRQIPGERLSVTEPIFLDIGSTYSNRIPIPSVFYQSKQVIIFSKH